MYGNSTLNLHMVANAGSELLDIEALSGALGSCAIDGPAQTPMPYSISFTLKDKKTVSLGFVVTLFSESVDGLTVHKMELWQYK
jgi:hypothetical protein